MQTCKKLIHVPGVVHTSLKFVLLSGVVDTHLDFQ